MVQRADYAIRWINRYPVDSVVCFVSIYPQDSDLSVDRVIEYFHMTSRRPFWCSKTMNRRATMLVYQANPIGF